MELLTIGLRTMFFYFFILLAYRLMGKREIGQLGVIDLIVSLMIAEMAAISIENFSEPIVFTIIPILILIGVEILFAFISVKSRTFRAFFDGKPSLIICNGKINYHEMVKQRYTMDNLLLQLRQKEIKSLDQVEYAFLEPNGKLSIFKYNLFKFKSSYPMPLIVDGEVQKKALRVLFKTELWLNRELAKKNLSIQDVFYAFYKKKYLFIVKKCDLL